MLRLGSICCCGSALMLLVCSQPIAWDACYSSLQVDRTVPEVAWATPGTAAGLAMLQSFITKRLKSFGSQRNDPNKAALSNLSPWFHFGECPGLSPSH